MKRKNQNSMHYIKAVVKKATKDGRLMGIVGSTNAVDRYGEIVDQESWDLKNYKQNPVILWAHNLSFGEDRPPIGKAIRVEVTKKGLEFDIQFDMADEFAADIFRKYKEKFLNAFSVGFMPHRVESVHDENQPTLRAILKDNELFELSAVPVPANPEALQSLRARSFSVRSWDSLVKDVEDEQADEVQEAKDDQPATTPAPAETKPEDTQVITNTPDEGISADDTPSDEISGGDKSLRTQSPGNPTLEAQLLMVATLREATRQFQTVLALVNAERRAHRTPSERT